MLALAKADSISSSMMMGSRGGNAGEEGASIDPMLRNPSYPSRRGVGEAEMIGICSHRVQYGQVGYRVVRDCWGFGGCRSDGRFESADTSQQVPMMKKQKSSGQTNSMDQDRPATTMTSSVVDLERGREERKSG